MRAEYQWREDRAWRLDYGDDNGVLVILSDNLMAVVFRAENVEKTKHRILSNISEGTKLEDARNALGYAIPWELWELKG